MCKRTDAGDKFPANNPDPGIDVMMAMIEVLTEMQQEIANLKRPKEVVHEIERGTNNLVKKIISKEVGGE